MHRASAAIVVALLLFGCDSSGQPSRSVESSDLLPSPATGTTSTAEARPTPARGLPDPCLRVLFKDRTYFLTHRPLGAAPGVGRILGKGRTVQCQGPGQTRVVVYSVNEQSPVEAITISPPKGDVWLYTRPAGGSHWTHLPRIVADPGGAGPFRLGMSTARLKAVGAHFSTGGAVGDGRCRSFVVSWAGARIRGQVQARTGVEILYLDDWGETLEGIAVGDSSAKVARTYGDFAPRSLMLVVPAGRQSAWAFRFDWSHRPHTVAAIALIRGDQRCTTL